MCRYRPSWEIYDLCSYPGEGMHVRVESVIAFRDNKGNNWIRNAKGVLSEIKMNSYEYLKLDLPPDNWQSLESE